jgi:RNA polymerase sigma factor (sigma-70 family)
MILRVCRRILRDPHDAEDAFQATFLVLLRRSASVRKLDSVASWLHGVAYRVASSARSAAARRQRHEHAAARRAGRSATVEGVDPSLEFEPVLHEELSRLPERYRDVVVLCDLEGQTYEQASWHLQCPIGTVKSRLVRARRQLRDRLLRRGLGPMTGAVGASLFPGTALAAVPPSLVAAAIRLWPARVGAGVVSSSVSLLAEGWGWTMFGTQIKSVALAVALAVGLTLAGARAVSWAGEGDETAGAGAQAAAMASAPIVTEIRSEVEGPTTILWLRKEGTWVKKGRVLAELDSAALKDSLVNQEITTKGAEAAYQNAKLTREVAEIAVREYEEGIYKQDKQTAETEIKLAESELTRALERQTWATRMLEKGYISKQQKSIEEQSLNKARMAIEQHQTRLDVLERYTKDKTIKELQSEVEKAKADELSKLATWNLEKGKEAKLRSLIEKCTVRSPTGGLVIYPRREGAGEPLLQEGDPVKKGQVILWIISEPTDRDKAAGR